MKKILKQTNLFILSMLIALFSIFDINIFADEKEPRVFSPSMDYQIYDSGAKLRTYDENGIWTDVWWQNGIGKISVNGLTAFCIEPTTIGLDGPYHESEYDWDAETRMQLSLIAYYGWDTSNKTDDDYVATQYMIWEYIGAEIREWYGSFGNRYQDLKNEIQRKINSHNLKPSFDGTSHIIDVGESLNIVDENQVLDSFYIENDGGAYVSIADNVLKVDTDISVPANVSIQLRKVAPEYEGSTIAYKSNSISGQDVGVFKVSNPVYSNVNVLVNKFGSLKIAKVDEDGNYVPNVTFKTSYSADMSGQTWEYTTGPDGTVTIPNWNVGKVYIQEIKVPDHLIIDSNIYSVEIKPNEITTYTATNQWVRGKIGIIKIDEDTKEQIEGAVYGIYDENKNELERVVTAKNAPVMSNYYRYGTYYIKEITPPLGYSLNETEYVVMIDSNEEIVEVTCSDKKIKGRVQVIKKDFDTGEVIKLSGAEFSIYDNSNQFIMNIATNSEGIAVSEELEFGEYYLIETKAPDGYLIEESKIPFKIEEDGCILIKEKTNKRVNGSVEITKEDKETGVAQGDATLEGAVYGLYAREDIINPVDGNILYKAGTLISEQTIQNGKANWEDLYLGKYFVQEIKASKGYLLDETRYEINLLYENQVIENIQVKQTVFEQVKKQSFSILKQSSSFDREETIALEGAEFTVKLKSDVDLNGWDNAAEKDLLISDINGIATSKELPYGTYLVKETKAPQGYYLNEKMITVEINEENIYIDGEICKDAYIFENDKISDVQTSDDTNKTKMYFLMTGTLLISYVYLKMKRNVTK